MSNLNETMVLVEIVAEADEMDSEKFVVGSTLETLPMEEVDLL